MTLVDALETAASIVVRSVVIGAAVYLAGVFAVVEANAPITTATGEVVFYTALIVAGGSFLGEVLAAVAGAVSERVGDPRDRLADALPALFGALLVLSLVVGAAAPAAGGNNALDWSADAAPDVCLVEDELVVAEHNQSAMSSPLEYYGDDGGLQELDAHLSDAPNNSVGWTATHVETDAFAAFPRSGSVDDGVDAANASVLDASEWATAGPNASALSVTDSDGSAATSVESITVETDGSLGSGANATATYADVSITSDAEKRVLAAWLDVISLESGAVIELAAVDADGDRKVVTINQSADASTTSVVATTTVDGIVGQVKLADLATDANGDGSFGAIERVNVTVLDGDAALRVVGLDVERKSSVTVGEQRNDTDGDGELEVSTVEEILAGGTVYYSSVDSSDLSGSVHQLHVDEVRYCLSDLPSDRVEVEFNPAWVDSYAFPAGLQVRARLEAPAAIDLTHSGLALNMTQQRVSDRYVAVAHATGTGSTDLDEVSSWTDDTGDLAETGDEVMLLSRPPTGQHIDVRIRRLEQDGDLEPLRPPANPGGGGGPVGGSGGGIPMAIWGAVVGLLGAAAAWAKGLM